MRFREIIAEAITRITDPSGMVFHVAHNPTRSAFQKFAAQSGNHLRGLLSEDGENVYLWDAYQATHDFVVEELGLDGMNHIGYRNGTWEGVVVDPDTGKWEQLAVAATTKPAIQRLTPVKETVSTGLQERRVVLDQELTVFENPSASELRRVLDLYGELRGSAGPGHPLYVWDAHTWTHHGVHKYLGYLPYYLYFAKQRMVQAEEWRGVMRRMGDIYVGVKYSEVDARNREVPRPDIPLSYPPIMRAIGAAVKEARLTEKQETVQTEGGYTVYINPNGVLIAKALADAPNGLRAIDIDGRNFAVGDAFDVTHVDMLYAVRDAGYDLSKEKSGFYIVAPTRGHRNYRVTDKVRVAVRYGDENGDPAEDMDPSWWPAELQRALRQPSAGAARLSEDEHHFSMKMAVLLADELGATEEQIASGSGVPWGNEYMGGQGFILTMPDGQRAFLDATIEQGTIYLSQISVENRASGLGTQIMEAIRRIAVRRHYSILVYKVTNHAFFDRFGWLTRSHDGSYSADFRTARLSADGHLFK